METKDWDMIREALLEDSIVAVKSEPVAYPQANLFLFLGAISFLALVSLIAMRYYGVSL